MPKRRECDNEQLPVVKLLAGPPPPGFGYEPVRFIRDLVRLEPGAAISYVIDLAGESEVRIQVEPSRFVGLAVASGSEPGQLSRSGLQEPPVEVTLLAHAFQVPKSGCYEFMLTNGGRKGVNLTFRLSTARGMSGESSSRPSPAASARSNWSVP